MAGGNELALDERRDDRSRARRRDARHRRPVRRGQGGARRLLPPRVRLDGRRARLGRARSRAPSTVRSRCDRCTSTRRRCSCEVRAAHLRRRLRVDRPPGGGEDRAPCGGDAAVARALRGARQGRPERVGQGARRPATPRRSFAYGTASASSRTGPFAETKEIVGGVFLDRICPISTRPSGSRR